MAIDLKNNKHITELKRGLQNVQVVLQEGNVKLFVKQIIAVAAVFLLFFWVRGKNLEKINSYNGQIDAILTQKSSEEEYLQNKVLLLDLEPRFPDASSKNEWLLSQVLGVFKRAELSPQVAGQQAENDSNPTYLAVSLDVDTETGFTRFMEFLADIENRREYIRVSDFTLKKDTNPDALGNNKITMKFNTAFPKEKIASTMFKDYKEIMEKRQAARKGGKK